MAGPLDDLVIPDKPAFKPSEVCDLLKVQPYVLKSWENEFKDLGVAKAAGGVRVYRRADVERVARIKHLVFSEGLTLAGVRRRLEQDAPAQPAEEDELIAEIASQAVPPISGAANTLSHDARERVQRVRDGLRALLASLSSAPVPVSSSTASMPSAEGRAARRTSAKAAPAENESVPSLFGDEDAAPPPPGEPMAAATATPARRRREKRTAADA